MDKQEPGRRTLSWGNFVHQVAKKSAWYAGMCGFVIFSVPLLFMAGLCFSAVRDHRPELGDNWLIVLLLAIIATAACIAVMLSAVWAGKRAKNVVVSIPPIRINTANLPAEETLVRASAEPTLQQQSVLLRAASHCDTTPAEQLVRPADRSNIANLSTDETLGQTVAETVEQQQVVPLRPDTRPIRTPQSKW